MLSHFDYKRKEEAKDLQYSKASLSLRCYSVASHMYMIVSRDFKIRKGEVSKDVVSWSPLPTDPYITNTVN